MSNIKEVQGKPRLHVSVNLLLESIAAMLHDSVAITVTIIVCTLPQAILLAIITMIKSIDGFPFLSIMSMGLRFQATGALLISPGKNSKLFSIIRLTKTPSLYLSSFFVFASFWLPLALIDRPISAVAHVCYTGSSQMFKCF